MNLFRPVCVAAAALAFGLAAAPGTAIALPVENVTPINNRDFTPAMRRLIQNAKKSIFLQLYQARYYPEYPDTASNHFLHDLIDARKRGVEVYVVIDTGEWNPSNKNENNLEFVDRLTTSGAKIWEDSPSEVSHQKVVLVDDDIAVVSSVNWTFYALDKNHEIGAVIKSRPLVDWFRRYFWQRVAAGKPRANAQPVNPSEANRLAPPVPGAPADYTVVPVDYTPLLPDSQSTVTPIRQLPPHASNATSDATTGTSRTQPQPAVDVLPIPNRLFYPTVHQLLLNAKESITVVQRSFNFSATPPNPRGPAQALPGEPPSAINVFAHDLASAAKRGLKVRVVLDRTEGFDDDKNDEAAKWLRERGVEVLQEDPQAQTHAKMLIIDNDKTILGSTNWTRPAVEEGNEASVLITSPQVNAAYREYIQSSLIAKGGPYQIQPKSIWNDTAKKH